MANYNVISETGIQYLCGLIREIASASDAINDVSVASDKCYSSLKVKELHNSLKTELEDFASDLFSRAGKLTAELVNIEPTLETATENVLYYYSISEDGQSPYRQFLKINNTTLLDLGTTEITLTPVLDTLTSTDTDKALSANQGKVLNVKIDDHINDEDSHVSADEKSYMEQSTGKCH